MDEITQTNSKSTALNKLVPVSLKMQGLPSETDFQKVELEENLQFVRKHISSKHERYQGPKFYFAFMRQAKRIANKFQGRTHIEILRVINTCQNDTSNFLWGWINPPIVGDEIYGSSIPVNGWVIGRRAQPSTIQFIVGQTMIAETPVNIPRPDVVKAHFTNQVNCGYNSLLNVEALSGEIELTLRAVFQEQQAAIVGKIQFYKLG